MVHRVRNVAAVALLVASVAGCGSSGATTPSSNTSGSGSSSGTGGSSGACSSPGPLGSAKGTITATIDGSQFRGGVPTGESVYTAIPAVLNVPAQDFFVISATCDALTSIQISARATVGTTSIGQGTTDPQTHQPLVHTVILQLRQNGVAAGTWSANFNGGSGTITVDSVSRSAASGSFNVTLTPQSGASGNRAVSGTFSTTF
jgi:hypothetical protein